VKAFDYANQGTTLHAVEAGAGPTVLLLHGGMADHHAVLPYLQPLSTGFRVVTPDLRGSGKSWHGGPLSFDQLAEDMVRLLDALAIVHAVVIGVSSGTGTALRLALARPDRVAGLGLVYPLYAGSAAGYTEHQRTVFGWMDSLARQALQEGIEALRPLYANLPDAFREQALAIAMQFDPASVAATSQLLASGAQPFDDPSDLRTIRPRTLIIPGTDALHPPEVAAACARLIPNARCVEPSPGEIPATLAAFSRECFQHAA
jgi:pimeloyl-ACP methyl ester carboxylesterase